MLSTGTGLGMGGVGRNESAGEALPRATPSAQRGCSLHTACQPGLGEWDQGREGWLPGPFRAADGRENGALEMACIR